MRTDLFFSNPLSKCFEFETKYPASADILIEYCLSLPRCKGVYSILMLISEKVIKSPYQHLRYSKFFANPELEWEYLDASKIPNTFSQLMVREDLPKYGDGDEYLVDFDFTASQKASAMINKSNLQKDHHIKEKMIEKNAGVDMSDYTIPIHNLSHDLRMISL